MKFISSAPKPAAAAAKKVAAAKKAESSSEEESSEEESSDAEEEGEQPVLTPRESPNTSPKSIGSGMIQNHTDDQVLLLNDIPGDEFEKKTTTPTTTTNTISSSSTSTGRTSALDYSYLYFHCCPYFHTSFCASPLFPNRQNNHIKN